MPNHLSAFFYGEKADDRETVTVFDVGCSGGVGTEWDIFGSSLRAIGFDPLVTEIARLRQAERRPNVSYEAAFVGLNSAQEKEREAYESALSRRDRFFPDLEARSSARTATEILAYDYKRKYLIQAPTRYIRHSGYRLTNSPHNICWRTSIS